MAYRWSQVVSGILCAVVGAAIYMNTLECGICFDDEPAIKKNKDLRPGYPWSDLLRHDFWGASMESETSHKSYRPLCVATFRLNYLLHELQPMGYHLVNVLLHSAVCFLYVQLCGVVFGKVWPALIAGLLFAVHPIHTEAVAGLVGRTELLSALFFIGAFLIYRKGAVQDTGYRWLLLSFALCLCSALSKEQGITVVAVCAVYDFFILNKMDFRSSLQLLDTMRSNPFETPRWFVRFLKRALLLAAFTIGFLAMRIKIMGGAPSISIFGKNVNPPLFMDTPYRQLNWLYLCFVNSWLLLNPSRLSPDWRFGGVPKIASVSSPLNLLTLSTFAVVATLAVYCLRGNGKKQKVVLLGLSLLVLPYIPASNLFFPVGFVIAERVLYLPSMGFCFLVGFGLWHVIRKAKYKCLQSLIWLLILCFLVIQAVKVFQRNRDWRSNFTIYSAGAKFNPNNGVMLTNLGIEYAHRRNYTHAEYLYRTAIEVAPEHSRGYANLGGLMEALKRYDEAEEALFKAIEFGHGDNTAGKMMETYEFLIEQVIMRNESRLGDALTVCEEALTLYPSFAKLYTIKGRILLKMNRTKEALSVLEFAVQATEILPASHYNLGLAHLQLGNKAKAESSFRTVLSVDPTHKGAMLQLGLLLASTSEKDKLVQAQRLLLTVVAAEEFNKDALLTLANIYYELRDHNKASEYFVRFLRLSPKDKQALYKLGRLYYKMKKYSEAVIVLKRLVKLDPPYLDAAALLQTAKEYL